MNWKGVGFLAAILILAAGCGPKANAPDDVAAIKAIPAAYGQAVTAGDAAAIASAYADGAVRLDPNTPITIGKEAIQSTWQKYLDLYSFEEVDVAEDVQVVGDLGFARGTYTSKSTPKTSGAAATDDKGKWVSISRRQPDGSWKIVVDIWNTDLPVAQVLTPFSADELELLQIERNWTAAWQSADVVTLDAILADSFVENWRGEISNKAKIIATLKAGTIKPEWGEVSNVKVMVFGDHAVANGITSTKYTRAGKSFAEKSRWTDVFEKREGRWQAVFSHGIAIE